MNKDILKYIEKQKGGKVTFKILYYKMSEDLCGKPYGVSASKKIKDELRELSNLEFIERRREQISAGSSFEIDTMYCITQKGREFIK